MPHLCFQQSNSCRVHQESQRNCKSHGRVKRLPTSWNTCPVYVSRSVFVCFFVHSLPSRKSPFFFKQRVTLIILWKDLRNFVDFGDIEDSESHECVFYAFHSQPIRERKNSVGCSIVVAKSPGQVCETLGTKNSFRNKAVKSAVFRPNKVHDFPTVLHSNPYPLKILLLIFNGCPPSDDAR